MASPQLENGYTKISNELLMAIYCKINQGEWIKIVLFIIRITYGFNRKIVKSNYKSFATSTNIPKDRIQQLISELYIRKIITMNQISAEYFWVGLNKNYEEWHLEALVSLNKELNSTLNTIFK